MINRKSFKQNIFIMLFVSLILFTMTIGFAYKVSASQLNFSIDPVLPENQAKGGNTYFDLVVHPGEKQEIIVKLKNDTEKDVIVETLVNPATTNINGVVEYGETEQKLDNTAKYNIADLLSAKDNEIVIPAKSEKEAKFQLDIPVDPFNGELAGGITFKEKDSDKNTDNKKTESSNGLAIENNYAYVLAVVLRESDKLPEKSLNLNKVEADQVNARNVINAELSNPEPRYLNKLTIKTVIKRKNTDEILYSNSKENMQMAPNTSFKFPTKLEGKKLEAGKYTLEVYAQSGEKKWSFNKDFSITGKEAAELNRSDVSITNDKNQINYYLLLGMSVSLVFLVGVVVYLLRRNSAVSKSK